ncbi:MAG: phosphorylase family protein [Gammaproteobacteria bacterium]
MCRSLPPETSRDGNERLFFCPPERRSVARLRSEPITASDQTKSERPLIGIICAMPDEAEAFNELCPQTNALSPNVVSGQIGPHEVAIATCGLGKVRAALTASLLMERWHCHARVCRHGRRPG